jgi:hypothetical protein
VICIECQHDDRKPPLDDFLPQELIRLCREWKCAACKRTEAEIQRDLDAAASKLPPHEKAHDWAALAQNNRPVPKAT